MMRKTLILCLLVYAGFGCNSSAEKETAKTDATGTPTPAYAYTIQKPDNWEVGSSQNTRPWYLPRSKLLKITNSTSALSILLIPYRGNQIIWKPNFQGTA
jgi:hypothetical protein